MTDIRQEFEKETGKGAHKIEHRFRSYTDEYVYWLESQLTALRAEPTVRQLIEYTKPKNINCMEGFKKCALIKDDNCSTQNGCPAYWDLTAIKSAIRGDV